MVPWRSGLTQTWPSDHSDSARSSSDLGVIGGNAVRQWQVAWVEDPRLGAHASQETGGLLDQEAAVGAFSQRAVQQQDAWRVR